MSGVGFDSLMKKSNILLSGPYLFSLGLDDKILEGETASVNLETSVAVWKRGYNVVQWNEPICAVTSGPPDVARYVQNRDRVLNGPIFLAYKTLLARVHRRYTRCRMLLLLPTLKILLAIQIMMIQLTEPPSFAWMTITAQFGILISLAVKDMGNLLEPFALLGSVQLSIPILAIATLKSMYQSITGIKVDSIRKPFGQSVDLAAHYKLCYIGIAGVNVLSLVYSAENFNWVTALIRIVIAFSFFCLLFSDYFAMCSVGVASCCIDDLKDYELGREIKEAFLDRDTVVENENGEDLEAGEEKETEGKSVVEQVSIADVEGKPTVEVAQGTFLQKEVPEVV